MEKFGYIEYNMPKELAAAYLKGRKGEEVKKNPNEFLCRVVDREFGLKGKCVKVHVI